MPPADRPESSCINNPEVLLLYVVELQYFGLK